MSSLIAATAMAGPAGLATAAHLPDWRDAVPARPIRASPATPGVGPRLAIHWPKLVLGVVCLLIFGLYVQAVQLSVTRGAAFHQAQVEADLARVAEAAALRDSSRPAPRRLLRVAVNP